MPHFKTVKDSELRLRCRCTLRPALGIFLASTLQAMPVALSAQTSGAVAREVVQPTPTPEVERLNAALSRLARNSRDVRALVDAGNAALKLGDLDAAMGFFGRAQELSPRSPQAKMGMAAVMVRSDRPIDALRLFAEAEQAGASAAQVEAERALAYDLVGNNIEAQQSYRTVLARSDDPETLRRLAISLAIAGDRDGFEQTLLPLLEKQDLAAYRARAFGLAILGDVDEASGIANAVMPTDLASRIAPYLAYMPRLTKAQQAAAANLGIFPRAAEIGRDDPRIARFASSSAPAAAQAGERLAPQGTPLGSTAAGSRARQAASDNRRRRPDRAGSGTERARTRSQQAATGVAQASPAPASTAVTAPAPNAARAGSTDSRLAAVAREQDASQTSVARPSVSTFDLARAEQPSAQTATPEPRPSVADAFAGLASRPSGPAPATNAGAVDITAIEVPREAPPAPKEEAKPEPPKHPSRNWVQVATGRDRSALRFDWRRFARKAPDLLGDYKPHVVTWGQANRLLAGPVASASEARDLVNALKEQGLDSFTYTSPEGEEITILQ